MFKNTLNTSINRRHHSMFSQTLATSFLLLTLMTTGCSKPAETQANTPKQGDETHQQNTTKSSVAATNGNADNGMAKVSIHTTKGDVNIASNPKPVVVYDMTSMQNLAALGVAVDGLPAKLLLDNLVTKDAPKAKTVGSLFEPDLEALNAIQPQAILISGRMAKNHDTLKEIAPTLDVSIDTTKTYQSSKQLLADLGKLFHKVEKAAALQQEIDTAIAQTKAVTQGKGNGLIILVNGNKLSAYGDKSRFGFVHTTFGIPMADSHIKDARHGQPISFEYLQKTNPDWLFVLDRTAAIGAEGKGAKAVLDNQLMHQTKAWKNKHIVYLSPDAYLAFGGYYQWLKDANTIKTAFENTP